MEPVSTNAAEHLIPQWIPEEIHRSDHYAQGKIDVTWNPMSQEKQKIWSTTVSNDIQFFFTPGGYTDPTQWAVVLDLQLTQFNYSYGGTIASVPLQNYDYNNVSTNNAANSATNGTAFNYTSYPSGSSSNFYTAAATPYAPLTGGEATAAEFAIQAHHILENPLLLFRNATLMINNIQFEYVVNPMATYKIFQVSDGSPDWIQYMDALMGGFTPMIPLPLAPPVNAAPQLGGNSNVMCQYKSLPQFRIPDMSYDKAKDIIDRQINIVGEGYSTGRRQTPYLDFTNNGTGISTLKANSPFKRFQVIIPLASIFGFCQTSKFIPPSNTISVRLQKEPLLQEYVKVWGLGYYKCLTIPATANTNITGASNLTYGATGSAAPLSGYSIFSPIDTANSKGYINMIPQVNNVNIPIQTVQAGNYPMTTIGLEPIGITDGLVNDVTFDGPLMYPLQPINGFSSEPDVYLWDMYMRVFNFTPLERDKQTIEDAERAAANNVLVPFYRMSQLTSQTHTGYGQAFTYTASVTFRPVAIYVQYLNKAPRNKYMSGNTRLQTNVEQINCTVAGQLCNQNVMSWTGIAEYSALFSYKNLLDGRGFHYGDFDQRKPMNYNAYRDLHCVYYFNCDNITKKAEQDGTFNYVVDLQFRYPSTSTYARDLECLIYAEYEDNYGYTYENNVLKIVKQKSS